MQSTLVYISTIRLIRPTSVQFDLLQSTSVHSVNFVHSVHFGLFCLVRSIQFSPISVYFDPFQSNSVYFGTSGPIQCNSVHSIKFSPLTPFSPLLSMRSNVVHSVHLVHIGPIWSISLHFNPFGLFPSILVQFSVFT